MTAKNITWVILHECDEEYGTPTCWSAEINHEDHGKYIWITNTGKSFDVECYQEGSFKTLTSCKTFTSAKRWATRYL